MPCPHHSAALHLQGTGGGGVTRRKGRGRRGGAGPNFVLLSRHVHIMRHDGLCQHQRCQTVAFTSCPQRLKQLRKSVHCERDKGNRQSPTVQEATSESRLAIQLIVTWELTAPSWGGVAAPLLLLEAMPSATQNAYLASSCSTRRANLSASG